MRARSPSSRTRTGASALRLGRYRQWLRPLQGRAPTPDMPKLPVHFLIMRGRLPGRDSDPGAPFDQGKPVTIAATKWITVTPVKNIVTVALDYPQKARPAQEIEVSLKLTDDLGQPVAGEATFWMVDQAVLSLAKERPLDPLPAFIVERQTQDGRARHAQHGVRNHSARRDAGRRYAASTNGARTTTSPCARISRRCRSICRRSSSARTASSKIKVKLPDSLTIFKLRAKAISGPDRFGFATGEMLIRQDLVAQPALPRFVRRGDSFDAELSGPRRRRARREPAMRSLAVDGLTLAGPAEQNFHMGAEPAGATGFPGLRFRSRVGAGRQTALHAAARCRWRARRGRDRSARSAGSPARAQASTSSTSRPGPAPSLPAIAASLRAGSLRRERDGRRRPGRGAARRAGSTISSNIPMAAPNSASRWPRQRSR